MTSNSVLLYHGAALAAYGFGQGHPFGPDRHDVFIEEVKSRGLMEDPNLIQREPADCTEEDLALFHTPRYIQQVKHQSQTGTGFLDCGDTPAFKGVFERACTVVGTVLKATDSIMRKEASLAFVPIAGLHHASRDSAAGFCVFNDVGVAIEALRQRYTIERVAYVDIDAHHGDGVFYAFEKDPKVYIADAHEDGRYLYPGTGSNTETGLETAVGSKINLPLPPQCDDSLFNSFWEQARHFLDKHPAEFYILQCGADSLKDDPITHLQLTWRTHAKVAEYLLTLANKNASGRLLALGGGGYNRNNLAQAWTAVVEQMLHSTK